MNHRPLVGVFVVCCVLAVTVGFRAQRPPQPVAPLPPAGLPPPVPESPVGPPRVVPVSQPLPCQVTDHQDFLGRTEANASAEVRSRVGGTVGKVYCRVGEVVKTGDRLFGLDEKPFRAALKRAESELTRCEAGCMKTAAAYEKAQKSREAGRIERAELDKARARRERDELALLAARTALAQAKLNLEFTQVTTPLGGVVGRLLVREGGEVVANGTVLTVQAADPIQVRFPVDEVSWRSIRAGGRPLLGASLVLDLPEEEAGLLVLSALQPPPTACWDWALVASRWLRAPFSHRGTVTLVRGPNTTPLSPPLPGTGVGGEGVTAVGTFPNADRRLAPDRQARVRVLLGEPYRALLVGAEAVVREGKQDYLLVVNGRNAVEYRPVRLGPLEAGLRAVREGVRAEEWVVLAGVQRVRRGEIVEPRRTAVPLPAPKSRGETGG